MKLFIIRFFMFVFFLAFTTSDWGNPNSTDWIGPDGYNSTNLPDTCQFKAFREHGQNETLLGASNNNEYLYPHSKDYFTVLMARFGFVLLFQVCKKVSRMPGIPI